jgi:hypothetical protein
MQSRTLSADGFMMDHKKAIAKRVMLGLPSSEAFARYALLCLVDGDAAEADRWLIVAGTRNAQLFEGTVRQLNAAARTRPEVADFLRQNGLLLR